MTRSPGRAFRAETSTGCRMTPTPVVLMKMPSIARRLPPATPRRPTPRCHAPLLRDRGRLRRRRDAGFRLPLPAEVVRQSHRASGCFRCDDGQRHLSREVTEWTQRALGPPSRASSATEEVAGLSQGNSCGRCMAGPAAGKTGEGPRRRQELRIRRRAKPSPLQAAEWEIGNREP